MSHAKDELWDRIRAWNLREVFPGFPLHEALGWTAEEYHRWVHEGPAPNRPIPTATTKIVQDTAGEYLLPLPDNILRQSGFKVGDRLRARMRAEGSVEVRKIEPASLWLIGGFGAVLALLIHATLGRR